VYIPWSQEEENELQKLNEKKIAINFNHHNKVLENHQVANAHTMDDCGIERLDIEIQLRKPNALARR
jgi:hypothetical protein